MSEGIDFALQLGWDALVAAKPKRQLLLLSHDDRMEIYRGFERRLLADATPTSGYNGDLAQESIRHVQATHPAMHQ